MLSGRSTDELRPPTIFLPDIVFNKVPYEPQCAYKPIERTSRLERLVTKQIYISLMTTYYGGRLSFPTTCCWLHAGRPGVQVSTTPPSL